MDPISVLVKELEERVDDVEKDNDDNIERVEGRIDAHVLVLNRLELQVRNLRDENRMLKRKIAVLEAAVRLLEMNGNN